MNLHTLYYSLVKWRGKRSLRGIYYQCFNFLFYSISFTQKDRERERESESFLPSEILSGEYLFVFIYVAFLQNQKWNIDKSSHKRNIWGLMKCMNKPLKIRNHGNCKNAISLHCEITEVHDRDIGNVSGNKYTGNWYTVWCEAGWRCLIKDYYAHTNINFYLAGKYTFPIIGFFY